MCFPFSIVDKNAPRITLPNIFFIRKCKTQRDLEEIECIVNNNTLLTDFKLNRNTILFWTCISQGYITLCILHILHCVYCVYYFVYIAYITLCILHILHCEFYIYFIVIVYNLFFKFHYHYIAILKQIYQL